MVGGCLAAFAGTRTWAGTPAPGSTSPANAQRGLTGPASQGTTGSGPLTILTDGPVWTRTSGAEGWIPNVVSIGGAGSGVFSSVGPFSDFTRLFSSFDQDPPLPVLQYTNTTSTQRHRVSSADGADVHAASFDISAGTGGMRQVFVKAFSPTISAANWSYAWPVTTNGHDRTALRVSRDGSKIVAAVFNINTFRLDVAVFGATSATPLTTVGLDGMGSFDGLDISSDGTKLAVLASGRFEVWDLTTGQRLFMQYPFVTAYPSVGISGDGTYAAYGSDGIIRIFRRAATTGQYSLVMTHTLAGPNHCGRLDISDDGSTLAAAFDFTDTFRKVVVQTIDLPTLTLLMTDTIIGQGALQNVASDISISANGRRFALGEWGDELGAAPELRVYDRDQSVPVRSVDLPGSITDLELSADGRRVAVAAKATHANQTGGGGAVRLFEAGPLDVTVRGTPHANSDVVVELRGQPGTPALLLTSPTLATTPTNFGITGTLWLSRTGIAVMPAGSFDGLGRATVTLHMPSTVGSVLNLQTYSSSPRRLGRDWVRVTTVP